MTEGLGYLIIFLAVAVPMAYVFLKWLQDNI